MPNSIENRLQKLLDKQEIEEVILKYGRGIDRMDADLIRSILHPDAVFEHFDLPGGRLVGADEIASQTLVIGKWIKGGSHFLPQTLIDLDRDTAYTETYALTCVITGEPGETPQSYVRGIRLFHRFERREDGVWRIAYRTGRHDGFELRQPLPPSTYDRTDPEVCGQQGLDDLVYHMKALLRYDSSGAE